MIVEYIDAHRDEFGVEPICNVLQTAPSTYYAVKKRPPSARSIRDAVLVPILVALWTANYRVYGAHKLWKAARRAGHEIGRDQVARLMRIAHIHGVSRKRRLRTTRPDPTAPGDGSRSTASRSLDTNARFVDARERPDCRASPERRPRGISKQSVS